MTAAFSSSFLVINAGHRWMATNWTGPGAHSTWNPNKTDTDNDGIPDGPGGPLCTAWTARTPPRSAAQLLADADGDGILDGVEDEDGDTLNTQAEFLAGTDRLKADTDEDGWNDEAEVTGRGNPLDPQVSASLRFFIACHPGRHPRGGCCGKRQPAPAWERSPPQSRSHLCEFLCRASKS